MQLKDLFTYNFQEGTIEMRRLAFLALYVLLFAACGNDKSGPTAPEQAILNTTSWDISRIVPLDTVRSLPLGTTMFVRTEFEDGQMRDLEVEYKGVVDDFVPPMPVILLKVVDEDFTAIGGAAFGMSGSPVFYEGGTVGALSMGPSGVPHPPYYFMATPIQFMLGQVMARIPTSAKKVLAGQEFEPLAIPLIVSGLAPQARSLFASESKGRTSWLRSGSSGAGNGLAQDSFEPGRPLAAAILVGPELNVAGVGTITYVDDGKFVGFGHPFYGVGSVRLPVIGARVLAEIPNLEAPSKLFTLDGHIRGVLTTDRIAGVGGRLGEAAIPLLPVELDAILPDGERINFVHKLATEGVDPYDVTYGAVIALFAPVANRLDNLPRQSLRTHLQVRFRGGSLTVDQNRLYAGPNSGVYTLVDEAANYFGNYLQAIVGHEEEPLVSESIQCTISVIDSMLFAKIDTVFADTVVQAGQELQIHVQLRVAQTETREVTLGLVIPDSAVAGVYDLEVRPAAELDSESFPSRSESYGLGGLLGPPVPDGSVADIVRQMNEPDGYLVLAARLRLSESDVATASSDILVMEDAPDPFVVATLLSNAIVRQDVGLVLSGGSSMTIRVKGLD